MKQLLKNRVFVGFTCIVLALLLFFTVGPMILGKASRQVQITRVAKEIPANTKINDDMLETVKIGGYNMPSGVVEDRADIVGKYSTLKMEPGDYVFASKISAQASGADAYLAKLDGKKVATSISLKSLDDGLSGKLQPGDVISLDVADYGDMKQTVTPPDLQYVLLIAATTDSGTDSDRSTIEKSDGKSSNTSNAKDNLPSTLTVLVTPAQKKSLVDYNKNGTVHASLVYRGTSKTAQKFLDLQDQYLTKEQAGGQS